MSDHFYIDRATQKQLVTLLREIPELCLELQIAITKQDRLGGRGGKKTKANLAEMSPYGFDAGAAADALHNTLATTARLVCEQRGQQYVPIGYEADTIPITVSLHYQPGSSGRRDPGNLMLDSKAMIDGLIDAGLAPDDTFDYIHERMAQLHPVVPGERGRMWLSLTWTTQMEDSQ